MRIFRLLLVFAIRLSCFLLVIGSLSICKGEDGEKSESPRRHAYQPLESWKDVVIYALFVDRFYDGDPTNNKTGEKKSSAQFQGGDFEGVIQKLDYLKELGISAILLNPVLPSNSYHGYHPIKHFATERQYGDVEEYKKLIKEAHARDIRVLFDLVLNHVDGRSGFFKKHKEWFREKPETFLTLNERSVSQVKAKTSFFALPDFDHGRDDVRQYLLSVAKFWIDVGVDGFRMDAVTQIEPEFWAWFNPELKKYAGPDFFILGEIFDQNYFVLNEYVNVFDSVFDFYRLFLFADVFIEGSRIDFLADAIAHDCAYSNSKLLLATILDNHDTSRFMTRLKKGLQNVPESTVMARYRQALAWMLTNKGLPTILYGTELGFTDDPELAKSEYDGSRRVMSWDNNTANPSYQYLKKLIDIRNKYGLGNAKRIEVAYQGNVRGYGLVNGTPGAAPLLVLYNLHPLSLTNDATSIRFAPEINKGQKKMKDLLSGESLPLDAGILRLNMEPYQVRILQAEN